MAIYLGKEIISGINEDIFKKYFEKFNPYTFGQSIYSQFPLNNLWLKSDGSYYKGSDYPEFYEWILKNYNNPKPSSYLNVKIVGRLTNKNGVVSGFSASSYTSINFPSGVKDLEIVIKFKSGSLDEQDIIGSSSNGTDSNNVPQIRLNTNGKISVIWRENGISSNTVISINTWYYAKVIQKTSGTQLYLSNDGINYNLENSIDAGLNYPGGQLLIGSGSGQSTLIPFIDGTIDLNESYINIDGKRWWTGVDTGFKNKDEIGFDDYDFRFNEENQSFRLPLLDGSESLLSDRFDKLTYTNNGEIQDAPANGWFSFTSDMPVDSRASLRKIANPVIESTVMSPILTKGGCNLFVSRGERVGFYFTNSLSTYEYSFFYAKGNGDLYYYVGY